MQSQTSNQPTLKRDGDTYVVEGLAVVQSSPFRTLRQARAIAVRIQRDPASYGAP
jgi:hypothetical protein